MPAALLAICRVVAPPWSMVKATAVHGCFMHYSSSGTVIVIYRGRLMNMGGGRSSFFDELKGRP